MTEEAGEARDLAFLAGRVSLCLVPPASEAALEGRPFLARGGLAAAAASSAETSAPSTKLTRSSEVAGVSAVSSHFLRLHLLLHVLTRPLLPTLLVASLCVCEQEQCRGYSTKAAVEIDTC